MNTHPYSSFCICKRCRRHRSETTQCWPDGTPLPDPLEPGFASATPIGLELEKRERAAARARLAELRKRLRA